MPPQFRAYSVKYPAARQILRERTGQTPTTRQANPDSLNRAYSMHHEMDTGHLLLEDQN